MALRSLDNTLPAALARPKKTTKVPAHDENATPLLPVAADQPPEYILSGDLKPLPYPEGKFKSLVEELDSKAWMKVCEALNDCRRLAIHHQALLLPILEDLLLVMVKAMKNPRSALCKTSIMASADIFRSYGPNLLTTSGDATAFDHLLLQLLLKASQDKRFVCEEAQRALEAMAVSMSPVPLLNKLRCYVSHTNMRVRAKAAVAISNCASRMDIDTMKEFGSVKLLQVAAELLSDRLPEAREAARSIINSIYSGFSMETDEKGCPDAERGESTTKTWHDFCSTNLPPISAQSVAKLFLL